MTLVPDAALSYSKISTESSQALSKHQCGETAQIMDERNFSERNDSSAEGLSGTTRERKKLRETERTEGAGLIRTLVGRCHLLATETPVPAAPPQPREPRPLPKSPTSPGNTRPNLTNLRPPVAWQPRRENNGSLYFSTKPTTPLLLQVDTLARTPAINPDFVVCVFGW
ncbi:hypothetical protein AOLI_G00206080 [Acnodon oligacanthus]